MNEPLARTQDLSDRHCLTFSDASWARQLVHSVAFGRIYRYWAGSCWLVQWYNQSIHSDCQRLYWMRPNAGTEEKSPCCNWSADRLSSMGTRIGSGIRDCDCSRSMR